MLRRLDRLLRFALLYERCNRGLYMVMEGAKWRKIRSFAEFWLYLATWDRGPVHGGDMGRQRFVSQGCARLIYHHRHCIHALPISTRNFSAG